MLLVGEGGAASERNQELHNGRKSQNLCNIIKQFPLTLELIKTTIKAIYGFKRFEHKMLLYRT